MSTHSSTTSPHTPGPWQVTRCEDGVFMCHTIGDTICFGDPNHQEPDDGANFRLIAAAPTMFDALVTITQLKNDPCLSDAERTEMARNLAFAALASVSPPSKAEPNLAAVISN